MENKNAEEEKEKFTADQLAQQMAEEDVKERIISNSEEQQTPDTLIRAKGEAFLKSFREMPYTNDKVGKSFMILSTRLDNTRIKPKTK